MTSSRPSGSTGRSSRPPRSQEAADPRSESGAHSDVPPLSSADAFEQYCRNVHARLAQRASRRREFLQAAYERLTHLLRAAQAVGDDGLVGEVLEMRSAAAEMLAAALGQPELVSLASDDGTESLEMEAPVRQRTTPVSQSGSLAPKAVLRPHRTGSQAGPSQSRSEPRQEPRSEPRLELTPEELEAAVSRVQVEAAEWRKQLSGVATLAGPELLRLRAVACRARRYATENDPDLAARAASAVADIIDLLKQVGDEDYTIATDPEVYAESFQWNEAATRYEDMAYAQEVFDWWMSHRDQVAHADAQPLAEALAATQQRFNRLLFRIGAYDPYQQRMFDALRTWARTTPCYLFSLRPKVPLGELTERAGQLKPAYERAQELLGTATPGATSEAQPVETASEAEEAAPKATVRPRRAPRAKAAAAPAQDESQPAEEPPAEPEAPIQAEIEEEEPESSSEDNW
ncbi:MAG: hypothetical protein KGJ62_06300 [Armatimonadetes bacterium]|nr:hypothetical protein [Armatimonadota bacterium]MDE2205876.1 hypothetical protein [Armatimonadota bacterium]